MKRSTMGLYYGILIGYLLSNVILSLVRGASVYRFVLMIWIINLILFIVIFHFCLTDLKIKDDLK